MTTKQTIDGMPRSICHACVSYPRDAYCPVCDPAAQPHVDSVPVSAHWSDWSMVTLEIDGRHRTYVECGKPAAQPQPAPVAAAQIAGFNIIEDPSIPPGQIRMCDCNQGRMPCTCKPSAYDGFDNGTD